MGVPRERGKHKLPISIKVVTVIDHHSPAFLRSRFIRDRKHMGEPESFMIILQELFDVLDIKANPGKFLSTLPFQPKY